MIKILIFFMTILAVTHSTNWLASGNFTTDNITDIWSIIDSVLAKVQNGNNPIESASESISTTLNGKWSPAWNVVVIKPTLATTDAVVYGYGFNDHWFWANNYGPINYKYNILLWKDWKMDYCPSDSQQTYNQHNRLSEYNPTNFY